MDRNDEKERRRRRLNSVAQAKAKTRRIFHDSLRRLPPSASLTPREEAEQENSYVNRHHQNRRRCSCEMCRSPRRSAYTKGQDKLTIQERQFQDTDGEVW